MKRWMRPVLIAIVLMVLFLPALSEKADAATVSVSTMEELQEAVRVPYTTVKLQNDITFGEAEGQGVTISEDGIILDLNGYTLTSKEKGFGNFLVLINGPRVKICNGYLTAEEYNTEGIVVNGSELVILENLIVNNTANILACRNAFGEVYVNQCAFTQHLKTQDEAAVLVKSAGSVLLDKVTIDGNAFYMFDLNGEADLRMGNVTARRKGGGPKLMLVHTNADMPKTYNHYRCTTAELKLDGQAITASYESLDESTLWNGKDAYVMYAEKLESTMTDTFAVKSIALTITEPKVWAHPDYQPTITKGAAYLDMNNNGSFRNDIIWSDTSVDEDGNPLDPDSGYFQYGHFYEAIIYLTPKAGRRFTDSTTVTLNGETVKSVYREDLNQIVVYKYYKIPEMQMYEGGFCDVDLAFGYHELTGKEGFALANTLDYFVSEKQIRMKGDGTRRLVDLDKDGNWDALVVMSEMKALDDLPEYKIGLYVLPTSKVLNEVELNLKQKTKNSLIGKEGLYWFSTVRFAVWCKTMEISYEVGTVADQTYQGKALKPEPSVQLKNHVLSIDAYSRLTLLSGADYTLSYQNNVNAGTATVVVKGKGVPLGTLKKTFKIIPVNLAASATKTSVTGIKASYSQTGLAIKPTPTVKALVGGTTKTLKAGTDYTVKYTNNVNPGTATVTITGKGNFKGSVKKTFKITKTKPSYDRFSGADRYATSRAIADAYKKQLGVTKFSAICIADGQNYPDALAGAYFAGRKSAPILVVHQQAPTGDKSLATINYVKANLPAGKTVYILGGPGSVPDVVVTTLTKAGYKVEWLWGQNRYGSNLAILKKAQ
ncbi:MAG: cell wall-binding repeat-containing protein, partial [Firmicutes bacterium]|nr:cell wall-binding repeat-containing protein [Bacillota bacterium]